MSSKVQILSNVLALIEDIDESDREFVLVCLDAVYPRMRGETSMDRKPPKSAKKPSRKEGGYGTTPPGKGGGGPVAGRGGGSRAVSSKSVGFPEKVLVLKQEPIQENILDCLEEVLIELDPVISNFPAITRDGAADSPKMDRKSVQTRINGKRSELQKALKGLSNSDFDHWWAFESCNKIQAFRMAAVDALSVDGVRLRTNPLPPDFALLQGSLLEIKNEREERGEVSDYGFFTNNDQNYHRPLDDVNPDVGES
jgi:hypothetical protein